jgi:hypothetical protein
MVTPTLTMDRTAWEEAERERSFWQQHHKEFLEKYRNQFVAVRDGKVVATSYDIRDFLQELRRMGLDPKKTWFHYFADETAAALL